MLSTITVPFTILHEGRQEELQTGSITAQMMFKVAWNDRWQFFTDVAGKAVSIGVGLASIVRYIPLQYPSNPNLYATGISMTPAGVSHCTPDPSYDWAIITVSFSTLAYDPQTSQGSENTVYRTISLNMSSTVMTLPTSPFKFATGTNVRPNAGPGFLIPTAELAVTSHQVPYIAFDAIFPLIGTINNATFYGAATGCLMFMGAEASRQATSQGIQAWELGYKFQFRPFDWNLFFSPTPGVGLDFLVDASSGNKVYAYADFTVLP